MADTQNGYFITCFQVPFKTDLSQAVGSEQCVLCFYMKKKNEVFLLYHFSYLFYLYFINNQVRQHRMQKK